MKHSIIHKSIPCGTLGNDLKDSSSFSYECSSLAVVEIDKKSSLLAESWMASTRLLDATVLWAWSATGQGKSSLSTKHSKLYMSGRNVWNNTLSKSTKIVILKYVLLLWWTFSKVSIRRHRSFDSVFDDREE